MQGKELGLLFNATPHSVSLSFTFLSKAVFVNIVHSPRFIPSPCFIPSSQSMVHSLWSVFNTEKIGLEHDTRKLLCCLATIVMKNCEMFQKRIV